MKPWTNTVDSRTPLDIQHGACARKRAHPSRKVAKDRAAATLKRNGVVTWPYKCKYCGLWHLTSIGK